MTKQIIYKHYQRILTQWPVDLLRPDVSFQKAIQRRIDRRIKPSTNSPQDNVVANQVQATVPSPAVFNEQAELEQVNVLYSFLENRYMNKYLLSERMMRPASNPSHYTNLVNELDEAPKRSRLGALIHRWKGSLRWS